MNAPSRPPVGNPLGYRRTVLLTVTADRRAVVDSAQSVGVTITKLRLAPGGLYREATTIETCRSFRGHDPAPIDALQNVCQNDVEAQSA